MRQMSAVDLKVVDDRLEDRQVFSGFRVLSNGDLDNVKTSSASRSDKAASRRKIDRCIAYMKQHLNRPLQVAALAALANVSPSHFFALFKNQTGCAPMDYFTRLRMRQARWLLNNTGLSVKEIAGFLGYDDPFYFSRAFKSINQVAPSEYRSRQRNLAEPVDDNGDEGLNYMRLPGINSRVVLAKSNRIPNFHFQTSQI